MMPTNSYYKNHFLKFANRGSLSVLKYLGAVDTLDTVEVEEEPGGVTHAVCKAPWWNGSRLLREFWLSTHCVVRETIELWLGA